MLLSGMNYEGTSGEEEGDVEKKNRRREEKRNKWRDNYRLLKHPERGMFA